MQSKHIIPCGGLRVTGPLDSGKQVLPLNLWSGKRSGDNVTLEVEDLHTALFKPVPPEFEDLLEIAAYVFCADQATSRGGKDVDRFGERWRRHFEFKIPVRVPEFWNRADVMALLRETLEFLADDFFDFEFVHGTNAPPMQEYFPKLLTAGPQDEIEGVVLFSGGLDSLAGAVEESVAQKRRIMLVRHKPTDKLNNVLLNLERLLAEKAGKFKPTHLHVRIYKDKDLNKNYTQRTRSFLYAAIGVTVSRMLGLDLLRFYENGVVSMNLPVCAQVVGSRATRTTHPRVLAAFQRLFSAVAGNPFRVKNEFIWDTKADVIKRILKHGCGDLIPASISCAHVYGFSNEFPHCGTCSQCIDRRMGVVAAGAEAYDPAAKYKCDVFTGERPKDEDRMMVATYVERANQMGKVRNAGELIARYPEVARMIAFLEGKPVAVADKVLELHHRHAAEVNNAIEVMLARHPKEMRQRSLPRDCLLRLTFDSGGAATAAAPAEKPFAEMQEKRWETEDEASNVYRLRKGYKVWTLVFQGKPDVLADKRALELVEYLLKHPPDEAIHASELENRVDGSPLVDGAGAIETDGEEGGQAGAVGGVIQEATGTRLMGGVGVILKRKLAEQRSIRDDDSLPAGERATAELKLTELLRAHGRGGKMAGAAEQAVDRVRKAIKEFIKGLKQAEVTRGKPNAVLRAFGEHLERHLYLPSMGARGRAGASGRPGCFTYERPSGVVWKE